MKKFTKEDLQQLYVEQNKTIKEISEILECSANTVRKYIAQWELARKEVEQDLPELKENAKGIWARIKSIFTSVFAFIKNIF